VLTVNHRECIVYSVWLIHGCVNVSLLNLLNLLHATSCSQCEFTRLLCVDLLGYCERCEFTYSDGQSGCAVRTRLYAVQYWYQKAQNINHFEPF